MAHYNIKKLEKKFNVKIITQNIDDLHERAGSTNVIHLHGELFKARSTFDANNIMEWKKDIVLGDVCKKGFQIRPHIVWFGEVPFEMGKINEVVSNCEVFISIGTSGHVYPAAGLIEIAKSNSAHCIGVNLESPLNARYFDEFFQGKAGEILPLLVQKWIS